ncbi:hypothetical protein RZS08_21785, partial [Arthrospira platensis SPKY1]|nr:hypothetical protein [Arthrospira platensis SPKY1]
ASTRRTDMQVELSVNDIDLAMSRDLNAMKHTLVAQMNDSVMYELEDRAMDKLLLRVFGTTNQELVRDTMQVLLTDKDIQERALAMRAARRMGVDK